MSGGLEALQPVQYVTVNGKRLIDNLARNPRPEKSKELDLSELLENIPDLQLWRMRLESWRIVYAITEREKTIDVLAVRKRPPYDYGDLEKLLGGLT